MAMLKMKSPNTADSAADWQPGIGHNSNYAPPEELEAELAALRQAEAETEASDVAAPDLIGADLSGANLANSNLSSASLTEANLIEAGLSSADLQDADLWRANLARCVISPDNLHQALNCGAPD
jgi:uncharacterized protein YjbI with pentapeptide repeats